MLVVPINTDFVGMFMDLRVLKTENWTQES